jgi:SagB-type dehydrogenase family enzyme
MRKSILIITGLVLVAAIAIIAVQIWNTRGVTKSDEISVSLIELPSPHTSSTVSIESALRQRRSIRAYHPEALSIDEVSQLLWAAQGITNNAGHRTAPSAGALYPLEILLVTGEVEGLDPAVYRYLPANHALVLQQSGDRRQDLQTAALGQSVIGDARAVIVIAAVYERTMQKYGDRGIQYTHIEVGAAAQNIYLQAEALEIGTVFIGAFYEDPVKAALGLANDEEPIGLMPVGKK